MEESNTWLAATLPARAGEGADVVQVADALVSILQDLDLALTPTLGRASVELIYQRCFLGRVRAHPWMVDALEGACSDMDLVALKSTFVQQSSADAIECGSAFLQSFYDLLVACVGDSLTEGLLRPVWAIHPHRLVDVAVIK